MNATALNAYEWLKVDQPTSKSSLNDKILKLVTIYIDGFHAIYDYEQTTDFTEFLEKIREKESRKSDSLFISWFEMKAYDDLIKLLLSNFESNSALEAKLDFTISILNNELNWGERSATSTRSTLINSLTGLPLELEYFSQKENSVNHYVIKDEKYIEISYSRFTLEEYVGITNRDHILSDFQETCSNTGFFLL